MSSVAASHTAPAIPLRRTRRPSTLTVYRWELRKLVSQKRTYLGLGLVAILPLFFVVFQSVHQRHDRGGAAGRHLRLADHPVRARHTGAHAHCSSRVFMLPLVAALVAGDVVAAEDGNGTLKTILTRSVDRGQVFAAKALAAMTYATIAVFLSASVATVAGIAAWGFHSLTSLLGNRRLRPRSPAARVRLQRSST